MNCIVQGGMEATTKQELASTVTLQVNLLQKAKTDLYIGQEQRRGGEIGGYEKVECSNEKQMRNSGNSWIWEKEH